MVYVFAAAVSAVNTSLPIHCTEWYVLPEARLPFQRGFNINPVIENDYMHSQ